MTRTLFRRLSVTAPIRNGHPSRRASKLQCELLEDRTVPTAITTAGLRYAMGVVVGTASHVRIYGADGHQLADVDVTDMAGTGRPTLATGDVTGDGIEDVVVGSGPGITNKVRVINGATFQAGFTTSPFADFTGGVNVSVGDLSGDGTADIVASPNNGGGPRVVVIRGGDFATVASFIGIVDSNFRGGARTAVTDVNKDGSPDLIVAAGEGGGPRIAVYDGRTVLSGTPTKLVNDFFAFSSDLRNGAYVAAGDVNADGYGDLIFGAGNGGGPHVLVVSGQVLMNSGIAAALASPLGNFFVGNSNSRTGIQVAADDLNNDGHTDVIAGGWLASGGSLIAYSGTTLTTSLSTLFFLTAPLASGDVLSGLIPPVTTSPPPPVSPPPTTGDALVTLALKPLDINLLGLKINSSPITVTVSAESGSGALLGNALTIASDLVNLKGVSDALNNVLGSVVDLLNGASLSITDTIVPGDFSTSTTPAGTITPVLSLFVAPVHLNLLGAVVDTSPITLTIQAQTGDGLVLGNVLTALANLFNPPLPGTLDLDFINSKLNDLITQLNAMLPGINATTSPVPPIPAGSDRILQLVVPPINLNLLGLNLKTDQINVNADAITGNGDLLGNVLTTLLNTLNATPENLTTLSNNINALLAKVVGVLNASSLTISDAAVGALAPILGYLSAADLVTAAPGASVPVLDLAIASTDGTTPPVDVNLLGLHITTSNIDATLTATTGDGQILGNLVYNVSHLLDPNGTLNLLGVLGQLAAL